MIWRTLAGLVFVVFAAACSGGGDDGSSEPGAASGFDVVIELEVVGGELVGGSRQVDIGVGAHVKVVLEGDSEEQVHIHGYDLYVEPVEGIGELVFDAIIPGTFEVELEQSSRLLLRMTVS